MTEFANPQLAAWESFYVIVGSSAGALIGLQFVVITLISERRQRSFADALGAFATPTVVHFSGALIISAVMSAPWQSLAQVAAVVAAFGILGIVYSAIVLRRGRRQTDYKPVWQDWVWYTASPCAAYVVLVVAGGMLRANTHPGLFLVASAALALLLIGVHNAWDTVTHIVVSESETRTPA